jgi:hypothetical protein
VEAWEQASSYATPSPSLSMAVTLTSSRQPWHPSSQTILFLIDQEGEGVSLSYAVRITESVSSVLEGGEGGGVARHVDWFATHPAKIVPIVLVQSSPRLRLLFQFWCLWLILLSWLSI